MKYWRISLVDGRVPKDSEPKRAKDMTDILTIHTLRVERRTNPEAWEDLKRLIAEAEKCRT